MMSTRKRKNIPKEENKDIAPLPSKATTKPKPKCHYRLCSIPNCTKQVQQGGVCCRHGAKTNDTPTIINHSLLRTSPTIIKMTVQMAPAITTITIRSASFTSKQKMSSNLNALDLSSNNFNSSRISQLDFIDSACSVVSGLGGGDRSVSRSVSSKRSVRRRDVIRPMTMMTTTRDDDETANSRTYSKDDFAVSDVGSSSEAVSSKEEVPASDVEDYSNAFVLVKYDKCDSEASPTSVVVAADALVVHSHSSVQHHDISQPQKHDAFVLRSPTTTTPTPHPSPEERQLVSTTTSTLHHTLQKQSGRGLEPDESIRDKSFLHSDGPFDPPGESPNDRPLVGCMDVIPFGGDNSVGSGGSSRSGSFRGRNVQWMDPKMLSDDGHVDYNVLRHYEQLSNTSSTSEDYSTPITNALQQTSLLLTNPRTRIATISSGYKKANYFVREDLDTRIYFHQLEDAVGYMAKRGYVKMRGEEEEEWKGLFRKAHGVVKVGPTKKKQHYRKGKLVLILKKTISDNNTNAIQSSSSTTALVVAKSKKKKKKSSRSKRSSSSHSETSSLNSDASSQVTESSQTADFNESTTTCDTGRTSLGKSVRAGYKSYSERFLAEQECEKKQYLLAIMEGRPLDDFGYNAVKAGIAGGDGEGTPLLLTDGSTMGSVDPDADRTMVSSRVSSHGDTTTQGGSTLASNASSYDTSVNESDESKKSSVKQESTRRGVYGGGVQYFTPQQSYREEEEEGSEEGSEEDRSTDNEDFEEEDEDYSNDNTEQEENKGNMIEIEGSDMGSMFSEEESTHVLSAAGVESVTTMSTADQNEVLQLQHESNRKSRKDGR